MKGKNVLFDIDMDDDDEENGEDNSAKAYSSVRIEDRIKDKINF
jgi:hypothetical protein